jgi:hypothetical protein
LPESFIIWDLLFQIITADLLMVYIWNREKKVFSIGLSLNKKGFTDISERTNKIEDDVPWEKEGLTLMALFAL